MRYAKAVTDERAKYQKERKNIYDGRITTRSADGTLMDPTQARSLTAPTGMLWPSWGIASTTVTRSAAQHPR